MLPKADRPSPSSFTCHGCRRKRKGFSLIVSVIALSLHVVVGWRQWHYNTTTTAGWKSMWGATQGPKGRIGHSMLLDGTRIILFGGRDDETRREHSPRTYDFADIGGVLSFPTYEDLPLYDCLRSSNSSNATAANSTTPWYGACENTVPVGVYYNDVWVYELNCTRYDDDACVDSGWEILHSGAINAQCSIFVGGREICQLPSERYMHGAAMLNDRVMLVYGGFSQSCEDYCDDLWSFDLRDNTWLQIYETGHFPAGASPGKRWRFSMLSTGSGFVMFGGHRLWHGFAADNNYHNRWNFTDELPYGGYLGDMWFYDVYDMGARVPIYTENYGRWRKIEPQQQCFLSAGESWAERNDQVCESLWPSPRAGHAAVIDNVRGGMWLFGGYTTYFPYPRTAGAGAAAGTGSATRDGIADFSPYPTHPFYLSDLWFYNFTSGLWIEVQPVGNGPSPGGRMDHSLVLANNNLILMGGYDDNLVFDDIWYFNITTNRWLEKTTFVHALWPDSCTDDLAFINDTSNNCTELLWTLPLERDADAPFDIMTAKQQAFYYPDPNQGHYWGILEKGASLPPPGFLSHISQVEKGTPMFPYAATGPRQYARKFVWQINATHNATLIESCLSVRGEPTRILVTLEGDSSIPDVFVPQPRRQSPGWDGCRDRADNRSDLPNELLWAQPTSRSKHNVVYSPDYNFMVLFGGQGYSQPELPTKDNTYPTYALSDMWVYNINRCPQNCSNHGLCSMGFCFCDDGYYGVDCSNTSCPGDWCYYDEITLEQKCVHCCSAGYRHTEYDTYVDNVRKVPCSATEPGEVNGICDGFGTCQCAPPCLGDDCSIKDCPSNCSFNGWCSVEYPVSRCMCTPGYFGEACQYKECLNNCTYPNGVCNYTTGSCACRMMYNPYNNTRPYYPFGGEDCSWIVAFAAAPQTLWTKVTFLLNVLIISSMTILLLLGWR